MLGLYPVFLQTSCFYKYHNFTSPVLMYFKNTRQTYALHLMNILLNIFCYIISNVSNRKNLHRVQLMTKSHPDIQYYSKKQCHRRIQRAQRVLSKRSGAIQSRFQESLKGQTIKGMHPKRVSNHFPVNLGRSSQDSKNLSRMPKVIRGMRPSKS